MSKTRAVAKYGLTGVLTVFYGLAAYHSATKKDMTPEQLAKAPDWARKMISESKNPRRVAIVGASMATLTWMIALL